MHFLFHQREKFDPGLKDALWLPLPALGGVTAPPSLSLGTWGGMPELPEKQPGTDRNGDSLVCAHRCKHRALPSASPRQVWDMELVAGQAGLVLDCFTDPQLPLCPFRWLLFLFSSPFSCSDPWWHKPHQWFGFILT